MLFSLFSSGHIDIHGLPNTTLYTTKCGVGKKSLETTLQERFFPSPSTWDCTQKMDFQNTLHKGMELQWSLASSSLSEPFFQLLPYVPPTSARGRCILIVFLHLYWSLQLMRSLTGVLFQVWRWSKTEGGRKKWFQSRIWRIAFRYVQN